MASNEPLSAGHENTVDWSRPLPVDRDVARILDRALDGEDISVDEAVTLFDCPRPVADGDDTDGRRAAPADGRRRGDVRH